MKEIWDSVRGFISTDNIALLSVIITILIFVFSRRSELKYRKHDDKKVQYLKLIALMEKMLMGDKKDKKGDFPITNDLRKQFFDAGASLFLYGSKKLYREYLLFCEITNNPLVKQCKYYQDSVTMYVMADILTTMRKEVGLSIFDNIQANEALGFCVNDISNNPIAKETAYDAKFRIKMIKFELSIIDHTKLIFIKRVFYKFIKPLFSGVSILIKHLIIIPFGRLIVKRFPDFATKLQNNATSNSGK